MPTCLDVPDRLFELLVNPVFGRILVKAVVLLKGYDDGSLAAEVDHLMAILSRKLAHISTVPATRDAAAVPRRGGPHQAGSHPTSRRTWRGVFNTVPVLHLLCGVEEKDVTNLTLTVDDEILRLARIRAIEQGTSVNALVRHYLARLAGQSSAAEGVAEFLAAVEGAGASSGAGGRTWTRDELHDR